MMNWKQFLSILILILGTGTVGSLEFTAQTHYDTFDQTKTIGKIGFSFELQEQLTNISFIDATLQYKNAGQYVAYCTGNAKFSFLTFGGGIIYDIYNEIITPGIIGHAEINMGKAVALGGSYYVTVTPENIFKDYVQDVSTFFTIKLINTVITSGYNYRHIKLNNLKKYSHAGTLDIIAYDINSPIIMGLNSNVRIFFDEADIDYLDFVIDVGGSIEYDTRKFGSYFINGSANIFTFKTTTKVVPFSISIGARFTAQ